MLNIFILRKITRNWIIGAQKNGHRLMSLHRDRRQLLNIDT
jgi:hypothetical protein